MSLQAAFMLLLIELLFQAPFFLTLHTQAHKGLTFGSFCHFASLKQTIVCHPNCKLFMSYYTSDNSGKESFQACKRVKSPLLLPAHSPEVCWKHERRGMQLTQKHEHHPQTPPCHGAAHLAMPHCHTLRDRARNLSDAPFSTLYH